MGIYLRTRGPLARLAVEAERRRSGERARAVQPPPLGPDGSSRLDMLERLVRLRDAGALDQAEFAALKAGVMGS